MSEKTVPAPKHLCGYFGHHTKLLTVTRSYQFEVHKCVSVKATQNISVFQGCY